MNAAVSNFGGGGGKLPPMVSSSGLIGVARPKLAANRSPAASNEGSFTGGEADGGGLGDEDSAEISATSAVPLSCGGEFSSGSSFTCKYFVMIKYT